MYIHIEYGDYKAIHPVVYTTHDHNYYCFFLCTYVLDDVFAHKEHALHVNVEREIPIGCGSVVNTTMMNPTGQGRTMNDIIIIIQIISWSGCWSSEKLTFRG